MPFAELSIGWRTPLAWLIAVGAIALAWRRFSALERLNPPPAAVLLDLLFAELGPPNTNEARRAAIAELNQRISDVSFELSLLPATFTVLIRVSLASGSALALLGFLDLPREPLEGALRAAVCAVSGLVGAGVVSMIGRWARQRAAEIRSAWDGASRETGKALGTSLAAPGEFAR